MAGGVQKKSHRRHVGFCVCQPAAQVAGENLAGQGDNLAVASIISPENPAVASVSSYRKNTMTQISSGLGAEAADKIPTQ